VVFIFTLIPFYICKIFFTNHRKVFTTKDIISGIIIFSIIALPWYLIVIAKYPVLLHYFIGEQIFERLAKNKFNRDAPLYYFIPTLLITFFPAVLYFLKGVFKLKKISKNKIYFSFF
jgi:4-amino-4-deoxy-L-arabinose transferase